MAENLRSNVSIPIKRFKTYQNSISFAFETSISVFFNLPLIMYFYNNSDLANTTLQEK